MRHTIAGKARLCHKSDAKRELAQNSCQGWLRRLEKNAYNPQEGTALRRVELQRERKKGRWKGGRKRATVMCTVCRRMSLTCTVSRLVAQLDRVDRRAPFPAHGTGNGDIKMGTKKSKLSKTNRISTLFLRGEKMVVVMRKDGAGAPRGKNDFDGLHSKVGVGASL